MTPETPRWSIAPYFFVTDVVAAANFYRDKLGFTYERLWGEPPCFCIVNRNGAELMLSLVEDSAIVRPNRGGNPESGAWDAYIWVPDVTALHDELVAKGVTITKGLSDRIYNNREFEIDDCNGYRLCFGQDLG